MRELNFEDVINRLVSFIKEKTEEAKAKGVVIGISGGVDSATVA
ncbi:MAG TPA: NAD(+) synthetase, partial [Thermococcaceae archaeon]|nr:NAD(+) synthetase [Thermococcaceae archaeon]